MRKLKLLMAICALFVGGGNLANAREDVTSTYLTDAELSNETANWALTSNGGNHAWDGTNKYRESWHNTFTITQTTAALPAGYYQLSIQAAVEGGNSTTISLQATSGTNSSIAVYPKYSTHGSYADMAAWWAADASHTGNRNLNRIFTTVYVEEGQTLTATFKQTANNQWFVYGQMQLHKLTDAEGRCAQLFEAAYNSRTSQDIASGRFKQRFENYTPGDVSGVIGKRLNKTISSLPKGYYNVIINGGASYTSGNGGISGGGTGDGKTVFFANNASTNVTVVDRTNIGNSEFTDYTASNALVSDGDLEFGYNNIASGANWFVGSIKYIEYCGGSLVADAIALPNTGDMAADTWYYFDIDVAGDDYNATATTLGDIVCTNDGTQLTSSATGNVTLTATSNSLSATRYYVKSASANNLVIEAASYSYDVGAPTLSTVDGGYTQSSTFIVTFPSASTNDPSAEPAFVASSTATVNGNTVDLSAVTNGFSLDLGTLTAGTDYVISIPAGVYGYAGESLNSAISLTVHTPAVFNGVYYLYDAAGKRFLGRGANYGTRAVADKYGVAMTVATNSSNITTFTFVDNDVNLFDANSGNMYTDNITFPNFAIVSTTGGFYVVNKNTTGTSTYDYKLYIDGSNNVVASNDNSTVWTFKTDSERDAIVDAYPTDNINTVITAAGISTTAADFDSFLLVNYDATDKTSLIGTARFTDGVGDWTWTQVKGQDKQPAYGSNFAEVWVATGTYSQTVDKANLPAGIYKVTVDGYERRATTALSNTLGAAGYNLVSSYLAANDEQVRLTDWYSISSKPGNTGAAVTAFENGEATNEVFIYLDGNTDLTIKLAKPNYVWDCWTIFNNFTLTYYKEKTIDENINYTPVAGDNVNITLIRNFSNTNWNTFVVPFDIDNATLTAKFGTVDVAEYAEASADAQNATVTFTKMATPAITANTPVLLKTSTAPASVTFNGVQVKTGEAKVAGTNFDFVGSYDASKFVKTGDYYIYQNKIYKSAKDDGTFIKGTRAYIEAKTTGARIVDFTIDGVTSGIRDLNADLSECEGVVYNLNGQKVQNMKNGVFVKNGKKVVVK